jgi:hypothetical protein
MTDPKKERSEKLLKMAFDVGVLFGITLFILGLYLIWHPLAPLVGGLLIALGCWFAGYDRARRER